MKVYPNPTSDFLNIRVNGMTKGKLALYGLEGKLYLQGEVNYGTAILNVKSLTPGVYVLRIYTDDDKEIQVVKVVVGD